MSKKGGVLALIAGVALGATAWFMSTPETKKKVVEEGKKIAQKAKKSAKTVAQKVQAKASSSKKSKSTATKKGKKS